MKAVAIYHLLDKKSEVSILHKIFTLGKKKIPLERNDLSRRKKKRRSRQKENRSRGQLPRQGSMPIKLTRDEKKRIRGEQDGAHRIEVYVAAPEDQ